MCGRFTLRTPTQEIVKAFGLLDTPDLKPRYNIAPTQQIAAMRLDPESGTRKLSMFRWGLIPSWAEDRAIGNRMINARAESVAMKPAYRSAFEKGRCLVVADGFYEWKKWLNQAAVLYSAQGRRAVCLCRSVRTLASRGSGHRFC